MCLWQHHTFLHDWNNEHAITNSPKYPIIKALNWWFEKILKYSHTCLYYHLYETTTHLRWPMLHPPKPIPIQSLLYKMTTCLTWPATTLFIPQMKKTCPKQPLHNFIRWRNAKQCIKNKYLSNYIYSIATL